MTAAAFSRSAPKTLTDRQQYRLMFAATFPIFLGRVLFVRLGRWMAGVGHPAGVPTSLLAEARATSAGTLLFAFMG